MINKRLLIKNLLAHNNESSFYDKKQELDLGSKIGKAKFLKHVCAFSNSNPTNNSYLVIGVKDEFNEIVGVDFFDDSKIQNLVNAYFVNPPKIQYENIPFPRLSRHKVLGLITIYPNAQRTSLKKSIWKYRKGMAFFRRGSNSMPTFGEFVLKNNNESVVAAIQKKASNNIELTLSGVFDFINQHKEEYNPSYKVFKEVFVLCWAGKKKQVGNEVFFSRVDIELINEQVRLFYSALDEVKIEINSQSFIITEYIILGIHEEKKYYPLEKTIINFKDNGDYDIVTELLFEPPLYDKAVLHHVYNTNNAILKKLQRSQCLLNGESVDLESFPITYMICFLNGFTEAKQKLEAAKPYLKRLEDETVYIKYKEAMRVLRKVKYN